MITLSKIASLANVSVSTASKAFSMSNEISEETRNAVFEIAKKHGVFKKFYNAKYPKLVVGVICRDYNSPFYPDILKFIQSKLEEYGCDMSVASFNASSNKEEELYTYYTMYTDVDAILTIGRTIRLDENFPLPRVDISPWYIDEKTPTVVLNYESIRDAILYFYEKKVESVGFITPYKKSGKVWKFEKFMNEIYGCVDRELIEIIEEKSGAVIGYDGALSMIKKKRIPRAIFCERDDIAFGAIRAFYDNGYRVPEDVAIVGWNNNALGEYSIPTLSTIYIDTNKVVSESVDMLIKRMSGQECHNYTEVNSTFIARESSEI